MGNYLDCSGMIFFFASEYGLPHILTVEKKCSAGKIGPNRIFTASDSLSLVSSFAFKFFLSFIYCLYFSSAIFLFHIVQGKHMGRLLISPSPPLKVLDISFLACSLSLIDVPCSLLLWFCLSALHTNRK